MNSPIRFPITPALESVLLGLARNEWLLAKAEREYGAVGVNLSLFDRHEGIPSLTALFYQLISVDDEIGRRGLDVGIATAPEDTVGEKFFELTQAPQMPTLDGLRSALEAAEHEINVDYHEYRSSVEPPSTED